MRFPLIYLLCLLSASSVVSAQETRVAQLANLNPYLVDERAPIDKNREFFLQTPFAKPLIVAASDLFDIQKATVVKVELVYTAYREAASFDQIALNNERISALQKQLPELISNRLIDWQLIEQTGCDSPESCDSLFHGFIVTARHKAGRVRTEIEISDIETMLKMLPSTLREAGLAPKLPIDPKDTASHIIYLGKGLQKVEHGLKPPKADEDGFRPAYYGYGELGILDHFKFSAGRPGINDPEEKYDITLGIDERGYVESVELKSKKGNGIAESSLKRELLNMKWYPATKKGRRVSDEVDLTLVVSYSQLGIEKQGETKKDKKKPEMELMPLNFDSTVVKVLDRNNWQNIALMGDLTGSMSEYTTQILYWIRLELQQDSSRIRHIAFFNDGNRKSNKLKQMGATGGIYHTQSKSFEEIMRLAITCIRAGNGGDTPENNLETAVSAMRNCPECDEFVMVADNLATPRDMPLANQIGRPIRVIACGAKKEINPAYLNLARITGGSLHTREEDIYDLAQKREGTKFSIMNVQYEVVNNEIIASPLK